MTIPHQKASRIFGQWLRWSIAQAGSVRGQVIVAGDQAEQLKAQLGEEISQVMDGTEPENDLSE